MHVASVRKEERTSLLFRQRHTSDQIRCADNAMTTVR